MASTTLYPPIVDSYTPAFIASGNSAHCRLYYSLSKFSSSVKDIKSILISVTKQSSGENVVNKNDNSESNRYRATGVIIVNATPIAVEGQENLYYTDILNEDIKNGWTRGWIYKIQVRFSTVAYSDEIGQSAWLNVNINNFSEWSTYTATKAIGQPNIIIPKFGYSTLTAGTGANRRSDYTIYDSTFEFSGSYENADESEILYSYQVKLLDMEKNIVEDSTLIYANQYVPNQFYYLFKTEFNDGDKYKLELSYETLNKYKETKIFDFSVVQIYLEFEGIELLTAEDALMQPYSSVEAENNDGRIALKLYRENDEQEFFGNICLRRADSKSGFLVWTDIKMFVIKNQFINDIPVFYDYTAESGVWYKYGIQLIDTDGFRSVLKEIEPIKREFEFSFLLGSNNRQLRLSFDNTMGSFRHAFSESKIDTIGSKHPFITRNGNMDYRTFPVTGLISFVMDLDNLFTSKEDIYKYNKVVELYNQNKEIKEYDYTYERDFRNKVLEFLQDGKPKVFKSPTEGNIIVRLMDINTTPNTTLGRLIFSFTSNAYEIADATMENYLKYGFYSIEEYNKDLSFIESHLGVFEGEVPVGSNLFKLISDKYNNPSVLGNMETVVVIKNLSLEFTSDKMSIYNNAGDLVFGHNFELNGNKITVYDRLYDFDDLASFAASEQLILLGDRDNTIEKVGIRADFVYDIKIQPKKDKSIKQKVVVRNVGQILKRFYPEDSIYNDIYYKYFYNWDDAFRHLSELACVNIEADPGTVFILQDKDDKQIGEEHVMNETGVLNLGVLGRGDVKNIVYKRKVDIDGNEIEGAYSDILVDYLFYATEGVYGEE